MERIESFRPRFSWITSTPPLGRAAGEQRSRRRAAQPQEPEAPQRLSPRDETVRVILRDLLRQVPLQLRHDRLLSLVQRPAPRPYTTLLPCRTLSSRVPHP